MFIWLFCIGFWQPQPVLMAPVSKAFLTSFIFLVGGDEQHIPRVGQMGVEPPVFTKKVKPNYPPEAKTITIKGYVILEAILRKDGKITDIKVLRGLGDGKFGFEKEAIAALKQWEFKPGQFNGEPSDVRMTLKVNIHWK